MKSQEFIDLQPPKQITVLVAEDYANFRKILKMLIELDGDIAVVGEAPNGIKAVQLAGSLHPDVVVIDMAMPLLNGLEATRQIVATFPATRVLMLSAHLEPEYIKQAMMAGASGYLIKQSSTQFIASAIREALKGGTYFSTAIPKNLRVEYQEIFDKSESKKAV